MLRALLAACLVVATTPSLGEDRGVDPAAKLGRLAEVDVAVGKDGMLIGQVVSATGQPLKRVKVAVTTEDGRYAETTSNDQGAFAFRGVAGRAKLIGPNCRQPVRAWTGNTAPPSATPAVLLVEGSVLARGQRPAGPLMQGYAMRGKELMANPVFVAGAVGAAVAIPVAISNANDDDDPSSP